MRLETLCPELSVIKSEQMLLAALENAEHPVYVLGGGSNVLFPKLLHKTVLLNRIKGIEIIEENDVSVLVEVGAGENWHEFVEWAVERNYGGVENLSLIPGTVGAAPIQNIGAYGVELKDILVDVRFYHLEDKKWYQMVAAECAFGYRDSVFKRELKGKIFISKVRMRLSKAPQFNLSYGALKELKSKQEELTVKEVSDAVIAIRQSKLPDPSELPNTGSFFKNPIVSAAFAEAIKVKYTDMPAYNMGDGKTKIPAAWLIDQCGFKGKRYGDVGCYEKHALVIVNYGNASPQELRDHVNRVQDSVYEKFQIMLEPEVNIL